MAYGVLIESSIQAKDIDSLNKSATSTVAIAGGGLVSLVGSTTKGNDVFTATVPSATTLGGLYMAYNPSPKYTTVGTKEYAGLSADPRDYTNVANKPFTVFKPKLYDEIVVTVDCVDATSSSIVVGDFLESKADQSTLTRIAEATGATAGSTAFQVVAIGTEPYPQADIGMEYVASYKLICVQE